MREKFAAFTASLAVGWAAVPVIFQAFLVLSVLDIVTGFVKAGIQGQLSSSDGRKGMLRKVGNLALVATGWVAHNQLGVPVPLDQVIAGYFCSIEIISIVENLEQSGIRMPEAVKKALKQRTVE